MPGTFFVAAAGFIDNNGKLLILKRSPKHDYEGEKWEVVSGRFEQGVKTAKDELYREIQEELGENFKCELIAPIGTYHFLRNGDPTQEHIGIDYICKYISGDIQLSHEHTEYKWIHPSEIDQYNANDSIKQKVKLFGVVRKWFIENSESFKHTT